VAWLQVHAKALSLPNVDCQRLRIVHPCDGVEVDEHVVALGVSLTRSELIHDLKEVA